MELRMWDQAPRRCARSLETEPCRPIPWHPTSGDNFNGKVGLIAHAGREQVDAEVSFRTRGGPVPSGCGPRAFRMADARPARTQLPLLLRFGGRNVVGVALSFQPHFLVPRCVVYCAGRDFPVWRRAN